MKRDLDLVRDLMLHFESQPPVRGSGKQQWLNQTDEQITTLEHVRMLCEAGLLEGRCEPRSGYVYVRGLTWAGHDFVDAARNETVWAKAKAALNAVGAWTIQLVLEQLKIEVQRQLNGLML